MSAALLLLAAAAAAAEPDLILHNGKVFVAPGRYAEAVAVSGRRISKVGTSAEVLALKGEKTRAIDLAGRALVPGFHDAHLHLLKGGLSLSRLDLSGVVSSSEAVTRVKAYAAARPGDGWILGRGWDHTAFPGQAYPTAAELDAVVSSRPVYLTHVDGHLAWANTRALELAGIDPSTATGVLIEDAMDPVKAVLPKPGPAEVKDALRAALELARRSGVTSVQGPLDSDDGAVLAAWRELDRAGEVTLRWFAWGRIEDPQNAARLKARFADLRPERFRLAALKGFVDGVISARTAAMLEPYADDPATRGEPMAEDRLQALVKRAHQAGFQAALHAIGDRAVRMALDACEASAKSAVEKGVALPSFPCKIEHLEVVHPDDLRRFASSRAAASVQPSHMTYDRESQNYNPARLGARARHAFPWRDLLSAGAAVSFGTDWPVMPLHPRVALFAATTRRHFDGAPKGGWFPRQRLRLEEAVSAYTLEPARAIGRDAELGSIEEGRLADLVVLDRDLFAEAGRRLLAIEADLTVFDGRVVFERR